MIIARIPGHAVEATTTALETGTLYTHTACSCERRGPFGGSATDGRDWANEHLGAVQANRAREETRGRPR